MLQHCVSRWNVYILQKMIHGPSNVKVIVVVVIIIIIVVINSSSSIDLGHRAQMEELYYSGYYKNILEVFELDSTGNLSRDQCSTVMNVAMNLHNCMQGKEG